MTEETSQFLRWLYRLIVPLPDTPDDAERIRAETITMLAFVSIFFTFMTVVIFIGRYGLSAISLIVVALLAVILGTYGLCRSNRYQVAIYAYVGIAMVWSMAAIILLPNPNTMPIVIAPIIFASVFLTLRPVVAVSIVSIALAWLIVMVNPLNRPPEPVRDMDINLMFLVGLGVWISLGVSMRGRFEAIMQRQAHDLHDNQMLLKRAVSAIPGGTIFVFDTDMRYQVVGGDDMEMAGYKPADLEGRTIYEAVDPETLAAIEPMYRAILSGEFVSIEYDYMDRQFYIAGQPIRDESGQIIYGLAFSSDITERQQMEEQKMRITLEQERIKLLTSFIQDVSHEFRTPLSVINSSVYFLRHQTDPDKREMRLQRIEQQVWRVTRLVDSLLLMSRLDTGEAITLEAIALSDILDHALQSHQAHITTRSLTIQRDMPQPSPVMMADQDWLPIAFKEVLGNAVRYSDREGTIDIVARLLPETQTVQIEIIDDGPGMAEETMSQAFERFYRHDTMHTSSGFGLGLSIARRIIERHDGDIQLMSAPGAGTTVTILLPAAPSPADTPDNPPQA